MDYVSLAVRTENKDYEGVKARIDGRTIRFLHGAMGLATEVAELQESGDATNLKEELGDLMWYSALICHEAPFDLENIELTARFVIGKFSPHHDVPRQLFLMFERDLVRSSGRLVDALKKSVFYGRHLDMVKMKEDLTIVICNIIKSCNAFGIDYEDMKAKNIDKLRARYPDKFTESDALERDLDNEKKALGG